MVGGVAVVTGTTGGLGYETALGLARAGLGVVLTGRDAGRGAAALARLRATLPGAAARFELLDMADLGSVEAFAGRSRQDVAVLVNNAGVMALPRREVTRDGFERQFGANYLGHFALTGRLLPRLAAGRVVNVSSLAHKRGSIAFDDLQGAASYGPWRAYEQSKLAMLMFAIELERRSAAAGWGVRAFGAHPGWAATRIVANGFGRGRAGLLSWAAQAGFNALGQPAAAGAKPILYAALDDQARPGGYYGPCCWGETRGAPAAARITPRATRSADLARLWRESEALTGVRFG